MRICPKNWASFQHYKDRSPTWIKLHKGLLDDYEFQCLPVASRALAPMLWLLASEETDGSFDADPGKLAFRLRMTREEVESALKPLISSGFFIVMQDASVPLAEPERVAIPEKENKGQVTRLEQVQTEQNSELRSAAEREKQVFDAGKALLGKGSGGFITKLRAKVGDDGKLLALIRLAEGKSDPREFLGACLRSVDRSKWPKPDDRGRIREHVDAKTLFAMGGAIVGDGSDEFVRGLMDVFDGKLSKAAEILLLRAQRPPEWWDEIARAVRCGEEINAPSDVYPEHSY